MDMFYTFVFENWLLFVLFIVNLTFQSSSEAKDVVIKSKDRTVVFTYRPGIQGESGLEICEPNEACNIVHNRFWLPTLTERLCRCSEGRECPWDWSYIKTSNNSDSSININNRSVLQFCSSRDLENMKICSGKESAIILLGTSNPRNPLLHTHSIKANCKCSNLSFWKLEKVQYMQNESIMQIYKCATQWMCDSLDFCGHVRTDFFSTYYRCTCPENHWCIFTNKTKQETKHYVNELAYIGTAFKAYCIPH